jgi:hypothetical protein
MEVKQHKFKSRWRSEQSMYQLVDTLELIGE